MKKLSFFNKFLLFINSVIVVLLLVAYALPFFSPKTAPLFAVLSLTVPFLTILNALFFVYWLIKLKKQFLISGLMIVLGWFISSPIFLLSDKNTEADNDVKIMSYNVRMFNHYNWNKDKNLAKKTFDFINSENPDILSLQEFYDSPEINFSYPYQYIKIKSQSNKLGQAIYSKYPIINSGSLDFKNTGNNIIYADILKGTDTLRVYNIHLESLSIDTDKEYFGEKNSEKLLSRFKTSFQKQALQAEQFLIHEKKWKGKKIVCGDFNNTAYSWVYRKIKGDKNDAFIEAGKGIGKTFKYMFPLRIDFILVDPSININSFKTFDKEYSDHYPIQAMINW